MKTASCGSGQIPSTKPKNRPPEGDSPGGAGLWSKMLYLRRYYSEIAIIFGSMQHHLRVAAAGGAR